MLARLVGQKMTQSWGQQVVADNRPGANGIIAGELTAKANPDGHTLMFVAIGHAINPLLHKTLPYDTDKDFTPISLAALVPLLMTVHPALPASTVKDLIALSRVGKKHPTYASAGIGSSQHLATALFAHMAKIELVHVPYKGGGPAILDLLSGNIDIMVNTILSMTPHVKGGRLRALAVTTPKRNAALPDLPTVAETGLPGYESQAWYGLVGPKNLPSAVLKKISGETMRILNSMEVRDNLASQGAEPVGNTPEQFAVFIRAETKRYSKVVRDVGVSADY
ncbi:MAG: tripartite tricarboxylate transporter substrate binding protein [Gammaproteobacteria bacterium]|nr:tripartite tricarboxylate transporter substrate binding protein [Gammaproteobacteria bacterium]